MYAGTFAARNHYTRFATIDHRDFVVVP